MTAAMDDASTRVRDLDIADIRRLRVEPGETLVVTLHRPAPTHVVDRVREILKTELPAGVRMLLIEPGITLEVVSGADDAAPRPAPEATAPDQVERLRSGGVI